MTKTMIAPIILVLAMAIKGLFGIDIPQTTQDLIVQAVVIVAAVAVQIHGIYKNHKKEDVK
jgi:uncharacterized membrane protein